MGKRPTFKFRVRAWLTMAAESVHNGSWPGMGEKVKGLLLENVQVGVIKTQFAPKPCAVWIACG